MSTVDPQAPLVLDIRELGRRPGAQRKLRLSVDAPAGLGTDVLGVPEGTTIELQLRLEAVVEGVLASGTAWVQLAGECVRCLEAIEQTLDVEFQELYAYPDSDVEDDEASRLEGDLLDLEPVVRDAVVLALPFQPVCQDDCPGLCTECGVRLADDPDHRHDPGIDPRWAALAALAGEDLAGHEPTDDERAGSTRRPDVKE
ncbi:YceD family protein [Actinopolymorpha sp. B9G3]|uniref:YceD family protein n=1 Tax=unclassified Actinopolymorpha TaxID=2627063 RepID=UPI0032D94CAE